MFSDLLCIPSSIGVIGGKPGKALYIVGKDGDEFVYLDPHFVQPSTNRKNVDSLMETYFCDSYRTVKYESLDPSVGFCYYLSNLEAIAGFIRSI